MRRFAKPFARRRLLGSAATLLVLPLVVRGLQAAVSGPAAETVVRRLVEQIWAMLGDGGIDQAEWQRLMPLIEAQTDLELLARLALGRHWRVASPAQLDEYQTLYRRFLLHNLASRMRHVGGGAAGSRPNVSRSSRATRSASGMSWCRPASCRRTGRRSASTGGCASGRASR